MKKLLFGLLILLASEIVVGFLAASRITLQRTHGLQIRSLDGLSATGSNALFTSRKCSTDLCMSSSTFNLLENDHDNDCFSFKAIAVRLYAYLYRSLQPIKRSIAMLGLILSLLLGKGRQPAFASPASTLKDTIHHSNVYKLDTGMTQPSSILHRVRVELEVIKEKTSDLLRPTAAHATSSATLGKTATTKKVEVVENSDDIGVGKGIREFIEEGKQTLQRLSQSLQGAKLDALILFIATAVVTPLFKAMKKSPILGFLLTGTLLGPNGLNWLGDIHRIDMLGELGVVFFLFEMGLDLSFDRLRSMRKDVFGLGSSTFLLSTVVGTMVCRHLGASIATAITIASSLSLSSSAFVLQLLRDKKAMGSRYGKASFGILLLQDLAVVPVLIVVELLAGESSQIGKALGVAAVKAMVTLSTMSVLGRKVLDPLFDFVARSKSEEAFISIILSTVLLASFITQGIGLSNTLGAFLAGLLIAETKYRHQVESDISPFRGLLLGFFFITVGFSIDLKLMVKEAPRILAILIGMVAGKSFITTSSSLLLGIDPGAAIQTGLITGQGGEFAFVAFGIAERVGLLSPHLKKILLTSVALSMAATPALASLGSAVSRNLSTKKGLEILRGNDFDKSAELADDSKEQFVFVCGYGRVGKMVCDMLDKRLIKYIAIDNSPAKTIEARSQGLPVYFGDVNRPEILRYFGADKADYCVITVDDASATNSAILSIRKEYPSLPILTRAESKKQARRLEELFSNLQALCPMLPEESSLLTIPFGGRVLSNLGVSRSEVDAILDEYRKVALEEEDEFTQDFLVSFKRKVTSDQAVLMKNDLVDVHAIEMLDLEEVDEAELANELEKTKRKADGKEDSDDVDMSSGSDEYGEEATSGSVTVTGNKGEERTPIVSPDVDNEVGAGY